MEEKLGRYANELEELKARLALAAALLQPDPAPTEVQLTLVTDASSCGWWGFSGGPGGFALVGTEVQAAPLQPDPAPTAAWLTLIPDASSCGWLGFSCSIRDFGGAGVPGNQRPEQGMHST